MSIGIITCNRANNYGARLQAFALYEYLRQTGRIVEIIDYMPYYMSFKTSLIYNPKLNIKEWAKLFLQIRRRHAEIKKYNNLQAFSKLNTRLSSKTYHTNEELGSFPSPHQIIIAGSDQIWNPELPNGHDPAFYLGFANDYTKKISYAASLGVDYMPETPQLQNWLKKFDAISVRETSAYNIIQNLGRKADIVCDPVFLLDSEYWDYFSQQGVNLNYDYLLVYDFENSPTIRQAAKKISKAEGLKIISVSPSQFRYAHKNYNTCNPRDFVSLIKNARYILSNSLHACIYSIIFKKRFWVGMRSDGLNVRMTDLLAKLKIPGRILQSDTSISLLLQKIEYAQCQKELHRDIQSSKQWLERQLYAE